ncbi:hypothetical protein Tco_1174250 [Tanacetum coccineum]
MVPFYKQVLGFTMELKIPSSFKTTGLLQPWQTLCKIFSKCLTTRVTGWDQPPITDNANVHCFVQQNIMWIMRSYLWEGTLYSLLSSTSSIPYLNLQRSLSEDTKQVGYADTSLDESLMKMSKEELSDVAEVFGDRCSSDLFLKSRKQEKCGTWLMSTLASEEIEREPRSNKESLEVEITKDKEVEITKETLVVEITNVVIPVNVNDDDEEITDEVYELKRREKGKLVEETRNSPIPTPIRSPRIHTNLVSLDTEKLQELTNTHTTSSSSSPHIKLSKTNRLLSLFKTKPTRFKCYKSFFHELQGCYGYLFLHIYGEVHCKTVIRYTCDNLQMKFERNTVPQTACRTLAVRPRDQDDPHDDAHPEGENRNQEQDDDFDFWTDSYASDDDEIPTKQVSQDIMEEVSLTIDEAKLRKMADEIKEILVSSHPRKTTPLVHSRQKDPEAPALSLINQDLLYLKKGNSGPEKIILKQKEPGKSKEEIYSNSKIVQVIKTYWELGHEHKFITEIVARRANDCIVPNYADTGMLWSLLIFIRSTVIWERVHDFQLGIESYQQKVNLTAPTMTFPGIKDHEMFSIIYEPVHGIIYKNSKKEKRVMRHSEIHKFCDATLNRVLEGLKSYNNNVKYRTMRARWEMFVNGRPLGLEGKALD